MLGGGFGRRGVMQDFVPPAVLIAREVGRPVKVVWSREEDIAARLLPAGRDGADVGRARRRRHAARLARAHDRQFDLGHVDADRRCAAASTGSSRKASWPTCRTTSRTISPTMRSGTPTSRSGSGAASTTRRTASSRKASSTRWRMPPAAIRWNIGGRLIGRHRHAAKFLGVLNAAAERAGWDDAAAAGHLSRHRAQRGLRHLRCRGRRSTVATTARCACTGSSSRSTPAPSSIR